jgi:hypothetical protein
MTLYGIIRLQILVVARNVRVFGQLEVVRMRGQAENAIKVAAQKHGDETISKKDEARPGSLSALGVAMAQQRGMFLQRTMGNRAVGQLLQSGGPVIQRNLVKYDEILPPDTYRRWMPLKTDISGTNTKKGNAVGKEAAIEGEAVNWKTKVEWNATSHDDGVKMVADPLGPDHTLGSTPGADGVWADKRRKLERSSGDMSYVAGHLLNENLGGPGNEARNLAAIPQVANKKHSDEVEEKIKEIVNNKHGWVRYEVTADQEQDADSKNLWYTSAFHCDWYQLDPKTGNKVKGTHGHVDIDIPPPSYFNDGNDALEKDPGKSGKGVDRWDRDPAAAWSKVSRKEVVLTNTDDLSSAAAVMKPIQAVLDKMQISDTILDVPEAELSKSLISIMKASKVSASEKKANEVIETESKALEELSNKGELANYEIGKDLRWALENAPIERLVRLKAMYTDVENLYKLIYDQPAAINLMKDVQEALDKEHNQRAHVEKTAMYMLDLVIKAREERDKTLKSTVGFANNDRGAFGLGEIPSDLSYQKTMEQVQQTEKYDHQVIDDLEDLYTPMTPYRQEQHDDEMRTETEYKDFEDRGSRSAHKYLRGNEKKYKSNKIMTELRPRAEKYSKIPAHNYDKKLIKLLSDNKDHDTALVQLRILAVECGNSVIQPFIDMVGAMKNGDFGTYGTCCGKISDNYTGSGKKYKKIYDQMKLALIG